MDRLSTSGWQVPVKRVVQQIGAGIWIAVLISLLLLRVVQAQTLSVLKSFDNPPANPQAALVQGSDGSFYGTTQSGGISDRGTVFRMAPNGQRTVLVNFTGSNGSNPYSALVQASDSNFYGTTYSGGTYGYGTVFRLTPSGTLTTLVNFNGSDGSSPRAGLVQASDGNFYGTTYSGGSANQGTVFRLTPSGTLTILVSFTGSNGSTPYAGLVQASDGNFYGTTSGGGSSYSRYGTVFRITPSGTLTTLVNFTGTNGDDPRAALVQASDGNLYGTTRSGCRSGVGEVYKLTLP